VRGIAVGLGTGVLVKVGVGVGVGSRVAGTPAGDRISFGEQLTRQRSASRI
jgi:hypothetical protein